MPKRNDGNARRLLKDPYAKPNPSSFFYFSALFPISFFCAPSMSSWGHRGYSEVWLNDSNEWLYPRLHSASSAMETMARRNPTNELEERAFNQATRELLLAQASDWPFMISNGSTARYAQERLETHLHRFEILAREIQTGRIDEDDLARIEGQDIIFETLDYRAFSLNNPRP